MGEVSITEADLAAPDAGEQITQWISEKIEGLLAPAIDLDADALACVASALYLKDAWANEFDKRATKRHAFHAEGGDVDADFMTAEADMSVLDEDFGVVVGYSLSNGASMVFALSDEGTALADLIADGSLLEAVRDFSGEVVDVELHALKFECETTVDDMNMTLAQAGFATAEMPDLVPMTGQAGTPASYVHGARIAIDEDGIEAGGVLRDGRLCRNHARVAGTAEAASHRTGQAFRLRHRVAHEAAALHWHGLLARSRPVRMAPLRVRKREGQRGRMDRQG